MAWMPALEEAEKQMHRVVEQWMNAKDKRVMRAYHCARGRLSKNDLKPV